MEWRQNPKHSIYAAASLVMLLSSTIPSNYDTTTITPTHSRVIYPIIEIPGMTPETHTTINTLVPKLLILFNQW